MPSGKNVLVVGSVRTDGQEGNQDAMQLQDFAKQDEAVTEQIVGKFW